MQPSDSRCCSLTCIGKTAASRTRKGLTLNALLRAAAWYTAPIAAASSAFMFFASSSLQGTGRVNNGSRMTVLHNFIIILSNGPFSLGSVIVAHGYTKQTSASFSNCVATWENPLHAEHFIFSIIYRSKNNAVFLTQYTLCVLHSSQQQLN